MKTRFAPSPTGILHIGNLRTALLTYLHTLKYNGDFILRIDDTDQERSKDEYIRYIEEALSWLDIKWTDKIHQKDRIIRYQEALNYLIATKKVYLCYESPEELEIKRKMLLGQGKPPIYDRTSLYLSEEESFNLRYLGMKPYYRFKMEYEKISWEDDVKGHVEFEGQNISDPVIVRADKSFTYLLCSAVDDMDMKITNIIRGDDHLTNTAIQIQMLKSLGSTHIPKFAHLGLIKTKEGKISKRIGGYDIHSLKEEGILPITLANYLCSLGCSKTFGIYNNFTSLLKNFDLSSYSSNTNFFITQDLQRVNKKIIHNMSYEESLTYEDIGSEDKWNVVRENISSIRDIKHWKDIIYSNTVFFPQEQKYKNIFSEVIKLLPKDISMDTWEILYKEMSITLQIQGKELYLPIRRALTGSDSGPSMKNLFPLLGHEVVIHRMKKA